MAHGAKLERKSHVCGSDRKKKIGMDEEPGEVRSFSGAKRRNFSARAKGAIQIYIPPAFWVARLGAAIFVVATIAHLISQILPAQPPHWITPLRSFG